MRSTASIAATSVLRFLLLALQLHRLHSQPCKKFCGNIPVNFPFGLDDGCGAPQYRHMLNCSSNGLFFATPSGQYKVQSINYADKTVSIYDPSMSTCSILQPPHEFSMTDVQYAVIPPSPDTLFILVNCSVDSPVLNHYASLCFNASGHSCDELYASCNSFRLFHLMVNKTTPCCFTRYSTLRFMSLNILDCSHYTSVYDEIEGSGPLDWKYGMRLSYSAPESGCGKCVKSGGTCGFDTDTEGMLCICSSFVNSSSQCPAGSVRAAGAKTRSIVTIWNYAYFLVMIVILTSPVFGSSWLNLYDSCY
uniref:non-specific serine/threonine protein kinase n=1 Tax=Kalanchoe fedtschenkoi TaxID=63787 RepID=A0A7N0T7N8_KALFE